VKIFLWRGRLWQLALVRLCFGPDFALERTGANWYSIPGTASATSCAMPFDFTDGSIFHRLIYQ
jgi:hypothetical protein